MLQQVKDTYANAIIVDDVNGFDNLLVDNFVNRIEKFGLTRDDIDIVGIGEGRGGRERKGIRREGGGGEGREREWGEGCKRVIRTRYTIKE